ncbi:MAG: preprotein translocase subunit SecY [Anaerolineales bacterium]|nr:preprotein translocase subunit SecY [Anaerolineales bacterium]
MKTIESIRSALTLPDLRRRILITIGLLIVYRLAANIPVPGVDLDAWFQLTGGGATIEGGLLGVLNLLSGGAVGNFSVIAMGVYPYITASIIIQLLTPIIPYLEELSQEGEQGRNQITRITYYLTVPLAIAQAVGQIRLIGLTYGSGEDILSFIMPNFGFTAVENILPTITTITAMVAGTMFAVWLGEQITESGIGQGISLIIFGGIASQIPLNLLNLYQVTSDDVINRVISFTAFIVLTVVTVLAIVVVQEGERRVPVQYGRRVRGRKVYQGQSSYVPLKVNTAGMIPIIFAQAILTLPPLLASFFVPTGLPAPDEGFFIGAMRTISEGFNPGANPNVYPIALSIYWLSMFLFVAAFTFFYTDVMIRQQRIAQNLQQRGGFIPGIRPGKKTSDYIMAVVHRITLAGAVFLGIVAVLPGIMTLLGELINVAGLTQSANVINGSGLIIVVGVVIDTMRQIEAQLIMRNYESTMTG